MELVYIKNDGKGIKSERVHGKYVCHHNPECRCDKRECWKCGWNPEVAQARKEAFVAGRK